MAIRWLPALALALGSITCREHATRHPSPGPYGYGPPPPVPATTPASGLASPPPASSVYTPGPTPPPVTFTELAPLAFSKGAGLKLVPVAKHVYDLFALSPDAKSYVSSDSLTPDGKQHTQEGSRLHGPATPLEGKVLDAAVPSARFLPDGSRMLIWSFGMGALAVVEVATGRVLFQKDAEVCQARFDGPDQVVYHERSPEPAARLWRVQISTGQATPLGAGRAAEYCEASADGSAFLVHAGEARAWIAGRTGAALPIHPPKDGEVSLAKGAARYCLATERGMSCVRLPDGGVEQVWSRPTSTTMTFGPEGQHALISYVTSPEGVYDGFAYVDFVARTVRRLRGFRGYSGSTFAVHPGGRLISMGSGSGLYVYDMERGLVRFAAHRPLYENQVDPNLPRRVLVGTDNVKEFFYVDVQ